MVVHVVKGGRSAIFLSAVGQYYDMTVVIVCRLVAKTVLNVWIKEGHGFLRSIFGQFSDTTVCLVNVRYRCCGC